jgi:ssDNA-binding Zn-finger/Zn-ribbon topoisomerase 1
MKRLIEYYNIAVLHCYDCGKNFTILKEALQRFPNDVPCPECEKENYLNIEE